MFSTINFIIGDIVAEQQPTKIMVGGFSTRMFFKEVEAQDNICPKCNFHMRIGAKRRIEILTDKDSFVEYDVELKPNDPLKFVDKTSYKKRVEELEKKLSTLINNKGGKLKWQMLRKRLKQCYRLFQLF